MNMYLCVFIIFPPHVKRVDECIPKGYRNGEKPLRQAFAVISLVSFTHPVIASPDHPLYRKR